MATPRATVQPRRHHSPVAPSGLTQAQQPPDVVCVSHLRWDFVFQRPQHLLTRCARLHRVFYIEEPMEADGPARLDLLVRQHGIRVVVPRLPAGLPPDRAASVQAGLLRGLFRDHGISDYRALVLHADGAGVHAIISRRAAVVYDCMDELSAFAGAPPALRERESELLRRADVVFTGGQTLYEAKRDSHANVHRVPEQRRRRALRACAPGRCQIPRTRRDIPHPRLGFFGVIDERMDLDLLGERRGCAPGLAVRHGRAGRQDRPRGCCRGAPNIHYLGAKTYDELPAYLAGWDVALMPFARNEATRFISPTKTPEYLAAGRPVVSTSIRDVVRPYGEQGLARIADDVRRISSRLSKRRWSKTRVGTAVAQADAFLTQTSWDGTWTRMQPSDRQRRG